MKIKRIPIQIISLALISILPIVVGSLLYFNHAHFHFKTMHHGTLINPPLTVKELQLGLNDQKKWNIVYVNKGRCDDQCKKVDHQLHQVQKILNKDRDRVVITVLNSHYLKLSDAIKQTESNKIYLVDPIGNLFMYYPSSIDLMFVLKDMKRVLEVSQIG